MDNTVAKDRSHTLSMCWIPLTHVSKRLGHTNPNVTATVYAHAMPGHDDLAADAWEKFQREGRPQKAVKKKTA